MAHHKALNTKGKPVPELNLSPKALKAARAAMPKSSKRVRLTTLALPKNQVFRPDPFAKLHSYLADRMWLLDRLRLARVRKNQKDLTIAEWTSFKAAIEAVAESSAASPRYDEFVSIHVQAFAHTGASWGVHTHSGHNGRNFLAWHREFLAKFEARLQLVNPTVTIPYWDWANDRAFPAPLANLSQFPSWPLTRGPFVAASLPTQANVNGVMDTGMSPPNFLAFQLALERGPHGVVHNVVGGTMADADSPKDPIFWLHHAMVDKIWADWQRAHPAAAFDPANLTEKMLPSPIITRKVSEVLKTTDLGYVYA